MDAIDFKPLTLNLSTLVSVLLGRRVVLAVVSFVMAVPLCPRM